MHLIELVSLLFAGGTIFFLLRKKSPYRTVFVQGFLYALGFEIINMHLTYTYQYDLFSICIGGVPLYVPLMWASLFVRVVLYLKDSFGEIKKLSWQKKVLTVLLGASMMVCVDMSVDVIAVREGLWTWFLEYDQGRYGVSFGNFFGRFVVSSIFLFLRLREFRHFSFSRWTSIFLLPVVGLVLQTIVLVIPFWIHGIPPQPPVEVFLSFFGIMCMGLGWASVVYALQQKHLFAWYEIPLFLVHVYSVWYFGMYGDWMLRGLSIGLLVLFFRPVIYRGILLWKSGNTQANK